MSVFEHPEFDDHESVHFVSDAAAKLRGIIAIHDAGPMGMAGGGCRMWPYETSDLALKEALRLSKAMTYKLALAGLPAGGAKSIILANPKTDKTDALFEAMGRAVQQLGGRYIIGEDVGTNASDMERVKTATDFVIGHRRDSTLATAYGVFVGLKACVQRFLDRSLDGIEVTVLGVGGVGSALCGHLHQAGAKLYVSDIDPEAVRRVVQRYGAVAMAPEALLTKRVEVFSPCALSDALNEASINSLQCKIIAGGANNQLESEACAEQLEAAGIIYAPDFVINAGGVIGAAAGLSEDATDEAVMLSAEAVGPILSAVFDHAEKTGQSSHSTAVELAKAKRRERKDRGGPR